jgi:hypothetical protein
MLLTYHNNECIVAYVQLVLFNILMISVRALVFVLDLFPSVTKTVEFYRHITTDGLNFIYHMLQLLNKARRKRSHYPEKSLSGLPSGRKKMGLKESTQRPPDRKANLILLSWTGLLPPQLPGDWNSSLFLT